MNNIFDDARTRKAEIRLQIIAHGLSAEFHRHRNMVLGGVSTVLTTFVGTTIFTELVSQLGLNGKGTIRIHQGMDWFYLTVILVSISTPILAALHTFLHDLEDAVTHRASVEGYANVLNRLTVFLSTYDGSGPPAQNNDNVRKEYADIMKEYNSVEGKSLTLTNKAYRDARKVIERESQRAATNNVPGADTSATTTVHGATASHKLNNKIVQLKVVFGILVATDIFLMAWLARNYATPRALLVVFLMVAIVFIMLAILMVNIAQKRVGKGRSDKVREEIGWLKVMVAPLVTTGIFFLAWLAWTLATPEVVPVLFYGVTIIIVTGAIFEINRKAYSTIDELEES
jgi:hypothetical protein